jgi:hypothetical protein
LGFWLSEMGGFGREKDCQRGKMNCWRESAGGRFLEGKDLLKENCERGISSKSEGWDFKKAKKRTCDSTSLGAKTLREIMLKKS